ncbi:MAG: iron ABC transporter permease [Sneathiella sp.]|nr:iron ABC transporter permease [Sneathiella sp.]
MRNNGCVSVFIASLFLFIFTGSGLLEAQGFAGLGNDAEGFSNVVPGQKIVFPRDHGPHPDFRIEWWYLTANLKDEEGNSYGVQWTLFRQALTPDPQKTGWANQQLWMGHAALTSATEHHSQELFARGGIAQADVIAEPFHAWINNWNFRAIKEGTTKKSDIFLLNATGENFSYELELKSDARLVKHGNAGYSEKSDQGHASYYYSAPFLKAVGHVTLGGQTINVSGEAWMDREWSSQPLAADQSGWDWFSLHLKTGEKVMVFRLRGQDGDFYYSGSWINADGALEPLGPEQIEFLPTEISELADRNIPVEWSLTVRHKNFKVQTVPLNSNSWMNTRFPYWEGPVYFTGTHSGVGYLEMTGY